MCSILWLHLISMARILLCSSAVRVHDSQAYRKMAPARYYPFLMASWFHQQSWRCRIQEIPSAISFMVYSVSGFLFFALVVLCWYMCIYLLLQVFVWTSWISCLIPRAFLFHTWQWQHIEFPRTQWSDNPTMTPLIMDIVCAITERQCSPLKHLHKTVGSFLEVLQHQLQMTASACTHPFKCRYVL